MPKFKCSFSITETVEKTYVITCYEIDIPRKDCRNTHGTICDQVIKDAISDEILEAIGCGDFDPKENGELVETEYNNNGPEFITGPTKID